MTEKQFKVEKSKFWILEQWDKEKLDAWVFQTEKEAIDKIQELLPEIDYENIDEIGEKYNLQEVEIAKDKYNMKAVSWMKIALMIAKKN